MEVAGFNLFNLINMCFKIQLGIKCVTEIIVIILVKVEITHMLYLLSLVK